MTGAAAYAIVTLASWTAIVAFIVALYRMFGYLAADEVHRPALLKGLMSALSVGAASILLAEGIPHLPRPGQSAPLSIPVIWPILPFTAWAAATCLVVALFCVLRTLLEAGPPHPPVGLRVRAAAGWLAASAVFYAFLKIGGDSVHLARGAIPFSVGAAAALASLAIVATYLMAGTANKVRLGGYAKIFAIHAALLAGCVVFGLPFYWLLLTSFKEDRDMASPNGLIWVPRVQDTVSTMETEPPVFRAFFHGRAVEATVIDHEPNGNALMDIISPTGMQGVAFETPESQIHQMAVNALVVSSTFRGVAVRGYVLKEFDDGRKKVKILNPASLEGQVFVARPTEIEPVRHIGLRTQNYSDALGYLPIETDYGLVYFRNTLLVAVLSVLGTVLSSSLVAYAFSRLRFPGRDFLFGVMVSTMMLPSAVTLLPRFIIFKDLGWINTLEPLWVTAFFASAFNVFLLRQFFRGVPAELEEAAKIDGCSYLKSYWSVMLPQVKPALAVIGIWTFMGAWNDFMGPLTFINSSDNMTISYAVQLFSSDRQSQPGLLMAFATLSIIPVVLLFFFAQRYFIEGVTLSGFGGR